MTTLRLLSRLKVNQKVIFSAGPMVTNSNSLVGSFYRRYYQETRDTNITALTDLFNDVVALMKSKQTTEIQKANLISDATVALNGVANMFTTYNDDTLFGAKLDIVIRNAKNALGLAN
jgi:hypothetical protein